MSRVEVGLKWVLPMAGGAITIEATGFADEWRRVAGRQVAYTNAAPLG